MQNMAVNGSGQTLDDLIREGEEAFAQEDLQTAEKFFAQALDAAADSQRVLNNLGCVHFMQNNLDQAEQYLLRALELDRSSLKTVLNLAQLQRARGDFFKELTYRDEAARLAPEDESIQNDLAMCWLELGDIQEVMLHLRRSHEINPAQPFVNQALAEIEPILEQCQGGGGSPSSFPDMSIGSGF